MKTKNSFSLTRRTIVPVMGLAAVVALLGGATRAQAAYPVSVVNHATYAINMKANSIDKNLSDIRQSVGDTLGSDTTKIREATMHLDKMETESKKIALQMARMTALKDHGSLITNVKSDGSFTTASADGLGFDGSSLLGGNFGSVDDVISQGGQLVGGGIDQAPRMLFPCTNGECGALGNLANNLLSGDQGKGIVRSFANAMMEQFGDKLGSFQEPVQSLINTVLGGKGSDGSVSPLGDNEVLRTYVAGADDAYQSLVLNGTGADRTLFYSNDVYSSGYDPAFGGSLGNFTAVDMDDVLSLGYKSAYDAWNAANPNSTVANPYANYAELVAPGLMELYRLGVIKDGDTLSNEVISRAMTLTASVNSNLMDAVSPLVTVDVGDSITGGLVSTDEFGTDTGVADDTENQFGGMVQSIGLPKEKHAQYMARVKKGIQRLEENQKEYDNQEAALKYTKSLVESLGKLQQEAMGIANSLTEENAIPQITQLINDVNKEIADRQSGISRLTRTLDRLKMERYAVVIDLESYVSSVRNEHKTDAPMKASAQRHRAYMLTQATATASTK